MAAAINRDVGVLWRMHCPERQGHALRILKRGQRAVRDVNFAPSMTAGP